MPATGGSAIGDRHGSNSPAQYVANFNQNYEGWDRVTRPKNTKSRNVANLKEKDPGSYTTVFKNLARYLKWEVIITRETELGNLTQQSKRQAPHQ